MRKRALTFLIIAACWFAADCARADELRMPENAVAGHPMSIGTSGSGSASLFLVGPGQVVKHEVRLGNDAQIKGEELRSAGRWIAILRSGSGSQSQTFWLKPAQPEELSFLARPSRVPVARPDAISGMAFVFDKFRNLVLQPVPVNFSLSVNGSGLSRSVNSNQGLAWIRTSSASKAGAAPFVASGRETSFRPGIHAVA